jgi:hypothetical protein
LLLTSPSIIYEKQKIDLLASQIGLAKDMQDSTLFSRKYIYETIFGLTKDEWQEQEALVIEDTKTAFRIEQIKSEGNDPVKTNMSFGTPHDIASMHIANKFYDPRTKENVAGPGRPKETGTFGKHKDKTVQQVYVEDTGYLKWMYEIADFPTDTKLIAKRIYEKLQAIRPTT